MLHIIIQLIFGLKTHSEKKNKMVISLKIIEAYCYERSLRYRFTFSAHTCSAVTLQLCNSLLKLLTTIYVH